MDRDGKNREVFATGVRNSVGMDFNPKDGIPDADRNNDGFVDVETYTPMNPDADDGFFRDDVNSYMCPQDPEDPNGPLKFFGRGMREFSIPTKLGVYSTTSNLPPRRSGRSGGRPLRSS